MTEPQLCHRHSTVSSLYSNKSDLSSAKRHGQPTIDIGSYETQPGVDRCNALFFSDSGIGVDTPVACKLTYGVGCIRVILGVNASVLSYHILCDHSSLTSLLCCFSKISSHPLMGYGPIFWSNDFERGFHDSSIRDAQEISMMWQAT